MKRRRKFFIILLLLFISIGFAYLSSIVDIMGNSIVRKQSWDIHFESPTKVGGIVDATKLEIKNTTTVEFSVDLSKPKDTYEFTVDVVNAGTIDGMISTMTATELTSNQKKLFEYVITYDDGASLKEKQLLAHGTTDKFKVVVRYKDDIVASDLSENSQSVTIEFTVEYIQADNTAINRVKNSFVSVYNQETVGELVTGDEVNIGDEHFYIINEDTNKYVLFAKYNLYVGKKYENGTRTNISTNEIGYGLQSKNSLGNVNGNRTIGTVAFSQQKYWWDTSFKAKYGTLTDYENNIYDTDYAQSSGSNYSIAYYVNSYVSKLNTDYNASIIKGRLLTFSEASSMGCDISNYSCPQSFITTSAYWLGTAAKHDNSSCVFYIKKSTTFNIWGFLDDEDFGVRPVIEISKNYL